MNPIDNERIDAFPLSTSQLTSSPSPKSTPSSTADIPAIKKDDSPIKELIDYINNATQVGSAHENRLNQIKREIQGNSYEIDLHLLATNILVSENEF